ncbi:hypothetical protein TTHERM_000677979 (macronuclear) [Tetrahymena thermophila SB210]|uniref:Uncharacterized protein n=1 Tax=Tetrahymena thermophila (strain SB210) TaxID=312017 RepID=W7XDV0_TETTS|nr:hypothetical protein TTHERM_000677979 [Tetrahymena thermophila SB210]EWS70989.1 hypothetical protein TTHERM_000677979 [Tetrahymena thermophila SB210]|eukprot:XP_012656473.1 hypothetical protein TTHERM_000677979 [Tetrahymena thermophila SB210]
MIQLIQFIIKKIKKAFEDFKQQYSKINSKSNQYSNKKQRSLIFQIDFATRELHFQIKQSQHRSNQLRHRYLVFIHQYQQAKLQPFYNKKSNYLLEKSLITRQIFTFVKVKQKIHQLANFGLNQIQPIFQGIAERKSHTLQIQNSKRNIIK